MSGRNRRPLAKSFRLKLEQLETRLAPANVSVTSFHYDASLSGENLQETALNPGDVNATNFGKLADMHVDGYVYSQPLYMANLMISGQPHNVVFLATEHDSLYAFDVINDPTIPTGVGLNTLWQRSFINPSAGITTVPSGDVGSGDIVPEIGITGGGVIDATTNTLYLVAKTKEVRSGVNHYVQTLYAIDITSPSGANKTTPYVIGDSTGGDGYNNQNTVIQVAGAGADTSGGATPMVRFSAFRNDQRPSLQLLGGRVYVAWSSHGDNGPYHGWVVGFNETTLQPEKWFNITPNARGGGIWQSEGALSTDGTFIYFAEGNGFNGPNPAFDPAHGNYSESVMKLDPRPTGTALTVADYFTPFDWQALDNSDADLGSGGVMLLPDYVGSTAHPHLMVETGKSGKIYVIDRDNMGQFTPGGPDNVVQVVQAGPGGVWGNPSFYQENATSGLIYYHGSGSDTRVFRISNGVISPASPTYNSGQGFGFPGAQPIISSNGTNNSTAIDWELRSDNYGTQGPEALYAYNARPAANNGNLPELYDSNQTGQRDKLAGSVKFTTSIETNGWVFVGQEYNFSVFGLFPSHSTAPAAPTDLTGMGVSSTSVQLNWTSPSPNTATGIKIFRSTDGTNFTQVNTVAAAATTYTDTGLTQGQSYFYKIAATNQAGDSAQTPAIQVSPLITPPVVSIDNASSNRVALVWTLPPAARDHYSVERSTDPTFATFTTIAMNIPGSQTSYTDSDPVLVNNPGQYYYRIRAFTNPAGTTFALSNVIAVKIGPGSQTIDYFQALSFPPNPPDLQANGAAQFAEGTARLTPGVAPPAIRGSVFSVNEKSVLNFDNEFSVRLHEGTQPSYANGFAFVIQAISSNALGQGGQGLGYQGIPNSVMIKFDTYTNGTENGTGGSTGLFFGGDLPTVPHQTGEVNLPLDATMVNLESQSTKQIDLTYDYNPSNPGASVLHEEIVDADHPNTPFEHDYTVDIPSLLGLPVNGNTIGYVGFTASTGSGGFWELEDVTSWRYLPTGPAAPHSLTVNSGADSNTLNWKATSADELGYYVERSLSQTSGFTRIATLGAGIWTYTDSPVTNPQSYFYRVQAFNQDTQGNEQDSGYSNVASGAVVNVSFPNFATHGTITSQGSGVTPPVTVFPGNPAVMQLTDGRGNEATSAFYNIPVGTGSFTTTFTLQDQSGPTGSADGATFVIQNDPRGVAALGAAGGALGYGGITNSIAVMFDMYSSGSHLSTTKLLTGGSTDKTGAIDMGPSGITLGTGHPLQITLAYDGTNLVETVRDTTTNATFTHSYPLNLAQTIGGNTAYIGFTGGTGGEDATQQILSWTGQFQQAPPQLTNFAVSGPASATAGSVIQVTVTARDQYGNTLTNYTGTVHFTSSDAQAALPGNYIFTASDMGVHMFPVTLKTAGSQTVTATDTVTSAANGSASVTVNPGAASTLIVTGFPSPDTAGVTGTIIVVAEDPYGNTATDYTGTVHFTSSDAQADLPGDTILTNGAGAFSVTLKTAGTQAITATDTVTGSITGTQSGIVVNPAALSAFLVAGFPSPATAGAPSSFRVTAQDPYGNTVTGYTGTITFSSSDSQALLPPDYAFTASDHGTHEFGAVLDSAGSQSITATDTVTGSIVGTQAGIVVNPAGFLVAGFASPTTAGTSQSFTVSVLDAQGNVITGYTGTVHFTSTDPQAQLPADFTFTANDNGVETFTATLYTAGVRTITATDTVAGSVTGSQSGIEVDPAAASSLVVSGFPSSTTAGVSGTFTVTAYDPYGNVATGYTGTVSFSSSDPQASLPADYAFQPSDQGTQTFSATLFTAGVQSLTATDAANGLAGMQSGIEVTPAAAASFLVTGYPSPVQAGTINTFTVTALDPYGNVATDYTGTVHFTSSDLAANLQADYHFTINDHGTRTFAAVFNTPGIQNLVATDTVDATITGEQDGIEVDPPLVGQGGVSSSTLTLSQAGAAPATGAANPATVASDQAANQGLADNQLAQLQPLVREGGFDATLTEALDSFFAEFDSTLFPGQSRDNLIWGTIG
jgi:hypothetical protein